MEIQEVIVALIFIAALFYVGRIFYKSLQTKGGCSANCKCGIDFSNPDLPEKSSSLLD